MDLDNFIGLQDILAILSYSIVVVESEVYEVTMRQCNTTKNSHSLSFDGVDDYINIPNIAPELYTDAFTIMGER